MPTGQGSFLLSPFLQHLLVSRTSWSPMPLCAPLVASALMGSIFLGSWGIVVSLPAGQGSFPLSPSSSVFSSRTLSGCPRVFWVSHAVIYLQPGSQPVAIPRESVLPGVSPQGVIIVCNCTALCPRGPSEASGGSVTAHLRQHPGVLASLQRVGMLRGHVGCECPSLGCWSCVF